VTGVFGRRRRGQGLIEAALVLPVLVFLLLVMVDFACMLSTKAALTSAAREGARAYAVYQDADRARQVAEKNLRDSVLAYTGKCRVDVSPSGGYVTVTVSYDQPVLVPGVFRLLGGKAMPSAVTLSSAAVFRIEPR